jgi:hypothetical protein
VTAHNNLIAERLRISETAVRNDVSIMKQKTPPAFARKLSLPGAS